MQQNAREKLGDYVKAHREQLGVSQEELAKGIPNCNRSIVAHLEQGLRIPKAELLAAICEKLTIPKKYWEPFTDPHIQIRLDFEEAIEELTGVSTSLDALDSSSQRVADNAIRRLFDGRLTGQQILDTLNSILVFYDIFPVSKQFFERYFKPGSFGSVEAFKEAVINYQKDAVRLFSTFEEAFNKLNKPDAIDKHLPSLSPRDTEKYSNRSNWAIPYQIPDERLPDLGYISAAKVKQEENERKVLSEFLNSLADKFQNKLEVSESINSIPEKTRRRMDSLLRKFDSHIEHGLFSPLFAPDSDKLRQEAQRLAPKTADQITTMADTQQKALENMAFYLASDHMDVYMATSMRSDADFVSVNAFAKTLFDSPKIKSLKLRYFNPTQSWIDDRIAKGLIEALMLRRASATIYMAQKSDTFGKDSEASVALGQGKPVIVYVPKLVFPESDIDTEALFSKSRTDLTNLLTSGDQEDIDSSIDEQALFGKILTTSLNKLDPQQLATIAKNHWADFDLIEEQTRIPESHRSSYRAWLKDAIDGSQSTVDIKPFHESLVSLFVSNAITFEKRAKLFREIHPLALQVILSTGVLNGILVVRTVEQCAEVLSQLVHNNIGVDFRKEDMNYRLVEKVTGSTIRVISRHKLLLNAFATHYARSPNE